MNAFVIFALFFSPMLLAATTPEKPPGALASAAEQHYSSSKPQFTDVTVKACVKEGKVDYQVCFQPGNYCEDFTAKYPSSYASEKEKKDKYCLKKVSQTVSGNGAQVNKVEVTTQHDGHHQGSAGQEGSQSYGVRESRDNFGDSINFIECSYGCREGPKPYVSPISQGQSNSESSEGVSEEERKKAEEAARAKRNNADKSQLAKGLGIFVVVMISWLMVA